MNITQFARVFVAIGIQHAMGMRHIVISGLSRSTIFSPIISLMSRFSKEKILNIKYVFRVSLQLSSGILFILRRPKRDIIRNVY